MTVAKGLARVTLTRASGQVIEVNQAVDILHAWVQTKPLDLDDPNAIKSLDMLLIQMEDHTELRNMSVLIYSQETMDDDPVLEDTISLADLRDAIPLRVGDSAYYIFKFEDLGVSCLWKLGGFELWGELVGERF